MVLEVIWRKNAGGSGNQVWNTYGKMEEKHFELMEFKGKWDLILRPYYER